MNSIYLERDELKNRPIANTVIAIEIAGGKNW